MMTKFRYVLLLTFILLSNILMATEINIRVFADKIYKHMSFETALGSYKILDDNGNLIVEVPLNSKVELSVRNNAVHISKDGKNLGTFSSILMEGEGLKSIFALDNTHDSEPKRYYDEHLEVEVKSGELVFINIVNLENYVAGVVQSEVRSISDKTDFYKIQAIISRTYAMNNIRRHVKEGYSLCDDVHCQVYKSRNNMPIILTATVETSSLVVVDKDNNVITASFYSNSGGETVNSEDLWSLETSYLRSVKDTFSAGMRNYTWQKVMKKNDWLHFLQKHYNYNINNKTMRDSALSFTQEDRLVYFPSQIPLKFIRRDLKLRSTFFSVKVVGANVVLNGRGYGHGVGLSQEGAVRMTNLGYGVEDVLRHYYQGITVKNVRDVDTDVFTD